MNKNGNHAELGTKPIGKLFLQYALPSIIAMTAASLYNIADSIFIGQGVGALAISGLAITFPLINLLAAFGTMIGVGASTLLSIKLGEKNYETASAVLGNTVVLNIIAGFAFTCISLLFLDPILFFFGASEQTIPYAHDYMFIILLGSMSTYLYFGLNALLRSSGHPKKAMYATFNTVIINCILDPLFIFVFHWGIEGAAIATVLSQIISLIWQFKIFSNKNELLHFRKGIYKLRKTIVRDTFAIGLSPFLMNIASCLIIIVINTALQREGGDLAVGAYGIVNRVMYLIIMINIGFNQGMQPIAGFNYGAHQYKRVYKVLVLAISMATIVSTLGFIIAQTIPHVVASAFSTDQTLVDLAANGMRIAMLAYPFVGFQIVTSNLFQSIGKSQKSILLSLSRQVLILLPFLLILPPIYGVNGVWYSIPFSDFLASILALVLLIRQLRKFKQAKKEVKISL